MTHYPISFTHNVQKMFPRVSDLASLRQAVDVCLHIYFQASIFLLSSAKRKYLLLLVLSEDFYLRQRLTS
jgi:hypothetical protein